MARIDDELLASCTEGVARLLSPLFSLRRNHLDRTQGGSERLLIEFDDGVERLHQTDDVLLLLILPAHDGSELLDFCEVVDLDDHFAALACSQGGLHQVQNIAGALVQKPHGACADFFGDRMNPLPEPDAALLRFRSLPLRIRELGNAAEEALHELLVFRLVRKEDAQRDLAKVEGLEIGFDQLEEAEDAVDFGALELIVRLEDEGAAFI